MSWLFFNLVLALSIFANNVFTTTIVPNLSKVQDKDKSTTVTLRPNDTSTFTKASADSAISKEKKASTEALAKNDSSYALINKTAKAVEQVTSKEAQVDVTTPLSKGNKNIENKSTGEQADMLNSYVTPADDDDVNTDEDMEASIHSNNSTMATNAATSSNSTASDNTTNISNVTTSNATASTTSVAISTKSTTAISATSTTTSATISSTVAEKNNSLNADSAEPPQVFPTDKDVKSIETADKATIAKLNHMVYDTVPSELHNVTEAVTTETLNTNTTYPNEEAEMQNNSVTPMVMQYVEYIGLEDKKKEDNNGSMPSGVIALVTAITFAVAIVLAYVTMVIWRQYLEHRYGRRELLVNDLEFDTNDLRHFEL